MKPWWIAGTTLTLSGPRSYKIMGGYSFDEVQHNLVFCHREGDTVDTITSPDGVEMTESEFHRRWQAESSKHGA